MKMLVSKRIHLGDYLPYYYQIANLLRESICQGDLEPGAQLPKELDLARMYGVSRIPIRQALSRLEGDGLIKREHGRGTFIAKDFQKPPVVKLAGIAGWEVTIGTRHRFLAEETVAAGGHIAEFFELAPGDSLTRFRRLRMVGESPFYIVNYMLGNLAQRVNRADLQANTMLDILKKKLRIPLGRIHQTIQAIAADTEIAGHLAIEVMRPVLFIENYTCSRQGKPMLYSQSFYRGNQSKYSVELRSGSRRKMAAAIY